MHRLIAATALLAAATAAPVAKAGPQAWQGDGGVVRCESNDGRLNRCPLPYGSGRMIVERQYSRSACIEGRTWGQDRNGIWVDDGCRADFRSAGYGGGYGGGGYPGGGYDDGYNGGYDDGYRYGNGQTIRCESNDGRTRHCTTYGSGRARLVRQLSRSACIEGRTWGSDYNGVWVSQGCRAEFAFLGQGGGYNGGGYGGPQYGFGRLFRCESIDGRLRECAANTRAGVQLVRQLSRTACIQGRTWGYGRNGIWVAEGCRAEFRSY
jgi:hypothetical protein